MNGIFQLNLNQNKKNQKKKKYSLGIITARGFKNNVGSSSLYIFDDDFYNSSSQQLFLSS